MKIARPTTTQHTPATRLTSPPSDGHCCSTSPCVAAATPAQLPSPLHATPPTGSSALPFKSENGRGRPTPFPLSQHTHLVANEEREDGQHRPDLLPEHTPGVLARVGL
jgi:hypothetical protein